MIETENYSVLKADISTRLAIDRSQIIGVDGCLGSGKSTLAEKLATDFKGVHIDLDKLLQKNEKLSYIDRIDQNKLNDLIENNIVNNTVIVEGVCLLSILQLSIYKPDILIYVKRVSPVGVDGDINYFDPEISEGKLLAEIDNNELMYSRTKPHADLDRVIIRYHKRIKSYEKADYVYKRIENINMNA